jgi:hypothetical protein
MRIPLFRFLALAVAAVMAACGGDGGDPAGPGGGSGGLTAKIAGQPWSAEAISIAAQALGTPGGVMILGTQSTGGRSRSITITLYNVRGPGTYALGVGMTAYGGIGLVGDSGNSWITPSSGAAGSVTITALADGRIAGTFAYTAGPGRANTVGGNRAVTDGQFDLAFAGTLVPVPANRGGKVTATLNGQPYNAADVYGLLTDHLGNPGFQLSTVNDHQTVNIVISGVTAPGTFALRNSAPYVLMTAGRNGGDAEHCCWGTAPGAEAGTIAVTSITADRVQGTFSATLAPQAGRPATAPLVIADGAFDVGID